MGLITRLFRWLKNRKKTVLPCSKSGDCPYDYSTDSDRDVEGMPLADGDPRSCPEYGHVCPEFMEDFGLTVDELNIRATIHCGALIDHFVEKGTITKDMPEYKLMKEKYREIIEKYPKDKYPQYY